VTTLVERLIEKRALAGITRYGLTTALDRLGIATATAIRADVIGESITVASGKGWSDDAALTGALAEAFERWAAEPRGRIASRISSVAAIEGRRVDPHHLIVDEAVRLQASSPLEWVLGRGAVFHEPCWVPANAVFFPYEAPAGCAELHRAHTNGLASGEREADAVTAGLLECIERHELSVALARVAAGADGDIGRPPDEALSAELSRALERVASEGVRCVLHDITGEMRVPTVVATLDDSELGVSHLGSASALDLTVAADRAFLEAAQSRATWIQGAREDLSPPTEPVHPFFLSKRPERRVPAIGLPASGALAAGVSHALGHEPVVVTLLEEPVSVVRVVVPGAEVWALDEHRKGPEVASWLR
jgi:ribosomal protein S12 methylthiotransferase accessory factor